MTAKAFADSISARPILARERFIDHRHAWGMGPAISFIYKASLPERNIHRIPVVGRNSGNVMNTLDAVVIRGGIFGSNGGCRRTWSGERQTTRDRRIRRFWKSAESVQYSIYDGAPLLNMLVVPELDTGYGS